MKNEDILWLAGWLEGEGSFLGKGKCIICGACTDEDVIVRVASLFGTKHYKQNKRESDKPHYKDVYKTALHGERAMNLMNKLYPFMGIRRQTQIKNALKGYTPRKEKFTKEVIEEIKSLSGKFSQSKIAERFCTDRTTINKIINNKYIPIV